MEDTGKKNNSSRKISTDEVIKYKEEDRIHLHVKNEDHQDYTIVRKKDVRLILRPAHISREHPEYDYMELAGSRDQKKMRSFIITLKGKGKTKKDVTHSGEEFILVQKGSIMIVLNGKKETLNEGDSIYYPSTMPHRIENLAEDKSVILAVFYKK